MNLLAPRNGSKSGWRTVEQHQEAGPLSCTATSANGGVWPQAELSPTILGPSGPISPGRARH